MSQYVSVTGVSPRQDPSILTPSQWILGIHTTTLTLGLALDELDPTPPRSHARSQCWDLGRSMAQYLHPYLAEFMAPLSWLQVAGVGVAVGPGSFTGCRLGVTVARSLGAELGIPVFGLSSLAAMAEACLVGKTEQDAGSLVAVELDALRGEWYGGIYARGSDGGLVEVVPDQLWSQIDWQQTVAAQTDPCVVVDAGQFATAPPVDSIVRLAKRAHQHSFRPHWSEALPNYCRRPPIN